MAPADIVVIHDELDIDFGRIRLKFGGGEGGHNGLRSVASALGTKDFQRVRIGVGRPPGRKDPAAFVLENFTAAERPRSADLRAGRRRHGQFIDRGWSGSSTPLQNTVHRAWA